MMDKSDYDRFIRENKDADTVKLRLRYSGDPYVLDAIGQIELRRKAGDKFRTSGLDLTPDRIFGTISVEQSTSAAIALFHASLAKDAHRVLDMTMGLGTDAAAFAIIDGAEVTAIEMNPEFAAVSIDNYRSIPNIRIIVGDSVDFIKNCRENFDLVFIDPARRADDGSRVYNVHDCRPDVTLLSDDIFRCASRCMVKLSPMLDVSATIRDLPMTRNLYVVEERGECREILVDMEKDFDGETVITAVNGAETFSFTRNEESAAEPSYGIPVAGDVLHEPWPSIMKASPFRLLCQKFGCKALGANTHLYFSNDVVANFPGKAYRIEAVLPYQSGVLKRFAKEYGNASVSVRNFNDTAERVRAKLKVKENSRRRVIATTAGNGDRLLLLINRMD